MCVPREEALAAIKTALELLKLAVGHLAGEGRIERGKRDYYMAVIKEIRLPA